VYCTGLLLVENTGHIGAPRAGKNVQNEPDLPAPYAVVEYLAATMFAWTAFSVASLGYPLVITPS
jgi:hypothetical protein